MIGQLPDLGASFPNFSLASDGQVLYAHGVADGGDLYKIDPSDASVLDQIFGLAEGAIGLTFNSHNDLLYAVDVTLGSGGSAEADRFFSINPTTGSSLELLDLNDQRRIHDLVVVIPEPGGAVLLVILASLYAKRRRDIGG